MIIGSERYAGRSPGRSRRAANVFRGVPQQNAGQGEAEPGNTGDDRVADDVAGHGPVRGPSWLDYRERGAPAADVDALSAVVVRLSVLAADLGDLMDALDVNPVIVASDGCGAVDARGVSRPACANHAERPAARTPCGSRGGTDPCAPPG